MQFFHGTKIDFLGKRHIFFWVSLIINVVGILAVIFMGIDYGIDFKGGTEIAYKFATPVHTDQLRSISEKSGFRGAEIKSYGKEGQYLIRIAETATAHTTLTEAYVKAFPGNQITELKVDRIGPKIGGELKNQAFLAVFLSLLAILIYIAFRFEFMYGFGAVIAMAHDVIVTFTIILFANKLGLMDLEVNQQILAAMLTVVGFSVNDTVIIFDRIRENKDKYLKTYGYVKTMNMSINETLSRTINTVLTVVLVLAILVFMGGPVLQGFAFTMLIGIITGTYSSIYIASAFVLWYMHKFKKMNVETGDQSVDTKKAVTA